MDEKEKELFEEGNTGDRDFELLDEVERLKKNSVPKEDYEKLREKNKMLMKRIVEGGGQEDKPEDVIDVNELRKELFGNNVEELSNRDFWVKTLQLRHERLKEGVDIFLPKGRKTRYTRADIESANKVDEVISQMIADSEENPALFNVLFEEALN